MVTNVTNVTSCTGNGLRDWLVQRVSAVVMAVYLFFLVGYVLAHPHMDYMAWRTLFSHLWMKIISAIVLFNLILHAWIGMWTIFTDYVKPTWLRSSLTVLVILALIGYFIWGIDIFWSV